MKSLRHIPFLVLFAACSAGDLDIETIDFETASLQYCGTATESTTLLFKIRENEALILELGGGLISNEASDGEITSVIPGNSRLTYRIFDANVQQSYFCDELPPASPVVVEEIEAEAGSVLITTVQNSTDPTRFEHEIRLSGVSFVNGSGQRLTNLNVEDFGTLVTVAD